MKKSILFVSLLHICSYCSYSQSSTGIDKEKIKNEIRLIEAKFQSDLKSRGVEAAFYKYAAETAVIKRENDSLVTGRPAIKNYYSDPIYKNAIAEWSPDFIDISDDGSMAYTYGKYKWKFTDASGKSTFYHGVFHTVWKKMPEGWKYVWD